MFCICIDVVLYPKVKFFTLKFCFFCSFIKLPTFNDISTLSTFFFYWWLSPENKVSLKIRVLLSWHHNFLEAREILKHWFYGRKYIFQKFGFRKVWFFKILVTEPGGPVSWILWLIGWNVCNIFILKILTLSLLLPLLLVFLFFFC